MHSVRSSWSSQRETRHALAWEACRKVMLARGGPEDYCQRIARVFSRYGIEPNGIIRDAACGPGYATSPLEKKFERTRYSDGSRAMVEVFNENARVQGWKSRASRVEWQHLSRTHGRDTAILVLCNSLPYARSWAKESFAERFASDAARAVRSALNAFYRKLENGGMLLFDIYPDAEAGAGKRLPCEVNGAPVEIAWNVVRDSRRGFRTWTLIQTSHDGRQESFALKSLLLPHAEWIAAVKEAGFRHVEKLPESLQLEPEWYTAFVAVKRE